MENEFGIRIRKRRHELELTQRELAARVDLDFTYLSKIETGSLPPPSEASIKRLAVALEIDDLDSLFASAHKIPADLAKTLKDRPTSASYIVQNIKHATDQQLDRMVEIIDEEA